MKLHIGNGTVYLDGYINIDITGKLASEYPADADHNRTTVDKYYKFPFRENKDNNVTDVIMDAKKLIYEDSSIDEILCVNFIDHLTKDEFLTTLREWHRVLKTDGKLIIDVDDRRKQARMLADAVSNDAIEWALRLIYCDHAKEGRSHKWGYTKKYLRHILEFNGFDALWIKNNYIIHDIYPNFQICVQKK